MQAPRNLIHLRRLSLLAVIIGLGIFGFDTSVVHTPSACACVSQSEYLVLQLTALEKEIEAYAKRHNGRYPTVIELRGRGDPSVTSKITNAIDLNTKSFQFTSIAEQIGMIGYATTPDRRSYLLIGVMEITTYTKRSFFIWDVESQKQQSVQTISLEVLES